MNWNSGFIIITSTGKPRSFFFKISTPCCVDTLSDSQAIPLDEFNYNHQSELEDNCLGCLTWRCHVRCPVSCIQKSLIASYNTVKKTTWKETMQPIWKRPQTASLKAPLSISYSQAVGPFQRVQPMLEGPRFVASLATGHLFHSKKKARITAVTYQLQNVNIFLWHMKFLLLSDPNNHQVAPNQRPIRAFSFNLENLWKFSQTLGCFITTWTIISNISRSHCFPRAFFARNASKRSLLTWAGRNITENGTNSEVKA